MKDIFVKRKMLLWLFCCLSILCLFIVQRSPIRTGKLNLQTIYLSIISCFHVTDRNAEACIMLIDDDSGPGIYKIKEICDRLGVKATFATVPAFLDSARCDSLKKWQLEGYGIALHGFDHGRWKDWTEAEITDDIEKSIFFFKNRGFINCDKIKLVVSPSFYNTSAIRRAVKAKGLKLVMGANIVNPDTTMFQLGRLFLTKNTDVQNVREILKRAKERRGYVILGTHSSIDDEFSAEKTEKVVKVALMYGYKFI